MKFEEFQELQSRVKKQRGKLKTIKTEPFELTSLGQKLMKEKKYGESIEVFTTYLNLFKPDASVYAYKGLSLIKLKEQGEGLRFIEKGLNINPNCPICLFVKGYAQRELKGVQDQSQKESFYNIALAYFNNEKITAASEKFQDYIKLFPKDPVGHYWLGRCFQLQDKFSLAKKAFKHCSEIDPFQVSVHQWLGLTMNMMQDYIKAVKMFDVSINAEQEVINSLFAKGSALESMNKFGRAVSCQRKILFLSPFNKKAAELINQLKNEGFDYDMN